VFAATATTCGTRRGNYCRRRCEVNGACSRMPQGLGHWSSHAPETSFVRPRLPLDYPSPAHGFAVRYLISPLRAFIAARSKTPHGQIHPPTEKSCVPRFSAKWLGSRQAVCVRCFGGTVEIDPVRD
jgi:hypothetical protein